MRRAAFLLALTLLTAPARADGWTLPQKIWFGAGNGRQYARQMAYVDMTVSLGVTLVEAISWAPTLRVSGSAPLPTIVIAPLGVLAGPITHFAHGRILPGIVSFLGWAVVGGLAAFASFASGFSGDHNAAIRANLLTSFAGETVMTIADTLMASGSPGR